MAENTKISLIVPVYGAEAYIEHCARTLFEQTWQNIEYIFLNDGTPDRSIEIVKGLLEDEYKSRASQVTIINQENTGLGRARLNALKVATGDYVIWVDPDDWTEKDYIECLARAVVDNNAEIAICDYFNEFNDGTSKSSGKPFSGGDGVEMVRQIFHATIHGYLWNKLIKRELWNNERLCCPQHLMQEDMFFLGIIAGAANKVVWVDKPLYHYRKFRKGAITSRAWLRNRTSCAINMLDLHKITKGTKSTDASETDMVMRGVWYALTSLNFKKVMEYPDAIRYIAKVPLSRTYRSPMSKQVVMKMWCRVAALFL